MAKIKVIHDLTDGEKLHVYVNDVEIPDVVEVVNRSYYGADQETVLTIQTDTFDSEKKIQ